MVSTMESSLVYVLVSPDAGKREFSWKSCLSKQTTPSQSKRRDSKRWDRAWMNSSMHLRTKSGAPQRMILWTPSNKKVSHQIDRKCFMLGETREPEAKRSKLRSCQDWGSKSLIFVGGSTRQKCKWKRQFTKNLQDMIKRKYNLLGFWGFGVLGFWV